MGLSTRDKAGKLTEYGGAGREQRYDSLILQFYGNSKVIGVYLWNTNAD